MTYKKLSPKGNRDLFCRIFDLYLKDCSTVELALTPESHEWVQKEWVIIVKDNIEETNSVIVTLTELGKSMLTFGEL